MKLGFIGCGNMGTAMLKGILGKAFLDKDDIIVAEVIEPAREKVREELGVYATPENGIVAKMADVLVLAIKPQYYEQVIEEIKADIRIDTIIVTIAPGKTLAWVESQFDKPVKVVRTMPNTPALVQEGMTGVCYNQQVKKEELEQICQLLECFSRVEVIEEHLMDVVTGVSGSSPAYVFMFIEAMADAAVADGMPRAQAYRFAAQAVMGSAKMVLETGRHPGELKDMVCSPGGTTIQAVRVLEEKGMRSAVIEAMKSCVSKSRGL